jgi:hypothetical protein
MIPPAWGWGLILFPALGFPQPCADYPCDSAVVRLILDANGRRDKEVSDVARMSGGRIDGLSMQYLGLDTLPPVLGRLSALRHLGLDRNELPALPREIGQLTSLVSLQLDNNRLASLPPEIGHLDSLQWLILFSNLLTAVPPTIGRLSSLRYLRLEDNRLAELPEEIGRLTLAPVEGLDVRNNRLCHPSDSVATWVNWYSVDPGWKSTQTIDGLHACPVQSIRRARRGEGHGPFSRKADFPFFVIWVSPASREPRAYGVKGNRLPIPP